MTGGVATERRRGARIGAQMRLIKVFANPRPYRSRCKVCGAPLIWLRAVRHPRPMPFDAESTPVKLGIDFATKQPAEYHDRQFFHWENCEGAPA